MTLFVVTCLRLFGDLFSAILLLCVLVAFGQGLLLKTPLPRNESQRRPYGEKSVESTRRAKCYQRRRRLQGVRGSCSLPCARRTHDQRVALVVPRWVLSSPKKAINRIA